MSSLWALWWPRIRLWVPVVLWMGLIFVLSSLSRLPHPRSDWLDRLLSSMAHVMLFGTLAALWLRAMGNLPRQRLIAVLIVVAYGLLDEVHQAFVPGRSPDAWDVLCDAVGAVLGASAWTARRTERR